MEAPARSSSSSAAQEIERCCQAIESSRRLHDAKQQVRVLPLHGSLPPQQQRKAFDRPPDGVRKIVVSTNVAETSVTIADVVHVIDAGLAKVNSWNAATRMVTFRDERICAASAEQRRGRAGRVKEGHCYRMWPAKERLVPQAAPEIQRAPLEDLVLDACLLGASNPASFIADVLTPPKPSAVSQAVENLVSLQAIDNGEERSSLKLTPLGVHLGRLPVDPRLGKMLLLASLLECLSPILSVAAALSASARVFNAPRDKQEEASNAQREAYGSAKSDPLALAAAYDGWVAAREAGGNKAERAYCDAHYLNTKGLREIENGRRELLQHLQAAGFVEAPASVASASAHAHNVPLLRGIICAAFYPNLASATRTTAQGSRQQYEKLTLAGGDVQAWAHPSSINARLPKRRAACMSIRRRSTQAGSSSARRRECRHRRCCSLAPNLSSWMWSESSRAGASSSAAAACASAPSRRRCSCTSYSAASSTGCSPAKRGIQRRGRRGRPPARRCSRRSER